MTNPQAPRSETTRKLFTVQEANATLPLVRAIVKDITALAHDLRDRIERLQRCQLGGASPAHQEELEQSEEELEKLRDRMREYEVELEQLGVELKDYFTGLIDFPCWMNGRVVYLCWRLGEPAVDHWHELDAGFAGRQKLKLDADTARG